MGRILVAVAVVALAGGCLGNALGQTASGQTVGSLGTGTPVALGVVVSLLAAACGYGMAHMRLISHIADKEIHVPKSELLEKFRTLDGCKDLHIRLEASVAKLESLLR